jgi:hypothetical protein
MKQLRSTCLKTVARDSSHFPTDVDELRTDQLMDLEKDDSFNELETGYINQLQEFLQRGAPMLGSRPEQMYRMKERGCFPAFQAQIVLIGAIDETLELPWSEKFPNKKNAKQHAAYLALARLKSTGKRVHEYNAEPKILHLKYYSSGTGNTNTNSVSPRRIIDLPQLTEEMLAAGYVVLTGVVRRKPKSSLFDLDSEEEFSLEENDCHDPLARVEVKEQELRDEEDAVPDSIGRLGEEYAFRWLQRQSWVNRVEWLNEAEEKHESYDIRCDYNSHPGKKYVEVKTRWTNGRVTISREQAKRAEDPASDYLVLVVKNMKKLIRNGEPPDVQLIFLKERRGKNDSFDSFDARWRDRRVELF